MPKCNYVCNILLCNLVIAWKTQSKVNALSKYVLDIPNKTKKKNYVNSKQE